MSGPFIHAASYLGPDGFGNDRTGWRAWPPPLAESLRRGRLAGLHWSLVSASDPSRFLRMDLMCRLGFMAAELLDVNFEAQSEAIRERTGVCLESFTGSLDADIRFAQTPRPSIFAYTLPSTVIGEICIRFRLKGPVLSWIATDTEGGNTLVEAADWLRAGEADAVLCLGIEALDREQADAISLPDNLRPPGWHAAALLLGQDEQIPRSRPLLPGSLVNVCRRALADH
jgi:3-oxoacyl-(acyl-carrier-protein) synthase